MRGESSVAFVSTERLLFVLCEPSLPPMSPYKPTTSLCMDVSQRKAQGKALADSVGLVLRPFPSAKSVVVDILMYYACNTW